MKDSNATGSRGPRIAAPTYLIRDRAATNLPEVIRTLASIGFDGFELGGLYGLDPGTVRRVSEEAGIEILMDHVPYREFERDLQNVLAIRKELGIHFLAISNIPEEYYPGGNAFREGMRFLNYVAEESKKKGITLQYHNHGFDFFRMPDGRYPIELIFENVSPDLLGCTFDIGWCAAGGGDVRYMLQKYQNRMRVVHIKDYYASGPVRLAKAEDLLGKRGSCEYHDFEFRPVGYGILNIPALLEPILACRPEWITADHDASYCGNEYGELLVSRQYLQELLNLHCNHR